MLNKTEKKTIFKHGIKSNKLYKTKNLKQNISKTNI